LQTPSNEASAARKHGAAKRTAFAQGLLGALSVEQFLHRFWQRKPLLVRGAITEFCGGSPIAPEQLFAHAATDDVESRLVMRSAQKWSVDYGPFDELPQLRKRNWTLLVQGMDLVEPAAHEMLQRFRFIPDARLDDVMISFATTGGGVGPHLDSYDVFLIQASGRRRWQIGPAPAPQFVDGLPLRILQSWTPTETIEVGPGDLLYLPPGWGHDGVALDPCTTWSVGFRTPARDEFLQAWLGDLADRLSDARTSATQNPIGRTRGNTRYRDPGRQPTAQPAMIPPDLQAALFEWIQDFQKATAIASLATEDFIGRYFSEPKAHVQFSRPKKAYTEQQFAAHAQRHGVALDRRSRLLYDKFSSYLNGENTGLRPNALLRALADQRYWTPTQCSKALAAKGLRGFAYDAYRAGWIKINSEEPIPKTGRAIALQLAS